jgi:6-phospho-beta-glucosidase
MGGDDTAMAGKPLTLTVLGGGSYFTPSFVGTMLNKGEVFAGATVRLHDLDADRVAMVKAFCERFIRSRGAAMTFVETPDLDQALAGADFVIATFRIFGIKSLTLDETIPPRFGYFGNETVGPGGVFMAMRTVPVVLDVARRMKRLCPQAWLLNYANPTNFIGDALQRDDHRRWVALCDGYICPPRDIGVTVGLDHERIATRHAGMNHCSWVYEARGDGRDLLEEMRRMTPEAVEANLASLKAAGVQSVKRWMDIFRTMGLYPAPAGHVEPYFYYDEWVQAQKPRPEDGPARRKEGDVRKWDQLKAVLNNWNDREAGQIARTHFGGHADLAIGVAAALATGSGEVFPVNVPHGGAVPGFSPDTVLEVYSKVTRDGFEPQSVPPFPPPVFVQQSQLAAVQKMVVTGILQKSRQTLLEALCVHPFTRSLATARALFDAMWKEEEEQGVLGPYWAS